MWWWPIILRAPRSDLFTVLPWVGGVTPTDALLPNASFLHVWCRPTLLILTEQLNMKTRKSVVRLPGIISALSQCLDLSLLGRRAMTNPDSVLKSRDITLPTKLCLIKAMVFPVVMCGCESWTIKKAEHWRIDAFELWCWRGLLRAPWTAGDPTSPSLRKSTRNIHWKDWCWS